MVSTFSPNKSIESPGHGDAVDTWDSPVNRNWSIIDTVFGGMTLLNATGQSGNLTLTVAQYQPSYIAVSGTLSADVTYLFPSGVGGRWIVGNGTLGNFTLRFGNVAGGQSFVIPAGARTEILSDGANVVLAVNTSVPAGPNGAVQLNENGFFFGNASLLSDTAGNLTATGNITAGSTLRGAALVLTGGATMTGLTATSLHVTGGTQLDGGTTIGTAASGEVDLIFRNAYGTVYPFLQSSGNWGVYDATNPRIRFSVDTNGAMTVSTSVSTGTLYASGNVQGNQGLFYSATLFSYNGNQSYYATSSGDFNYIFHSADGWRSQYQKSTGSHWWVDYASNINMSLDGAGNFGLRGGANITGNIATPNAVTAGYMHSTGSMNVDGTMQGGTVNSNNNVNVGYDLHVSHYVYCNYIQNYGSMQIDGNLTVNNVLNVGGNIGTNSSLWVNANSTLNNTVYVNNNIIFPNAFGANIFSGGGGLAIAVNNQPFAFHASGYAWNNGGWIAYSSRENKADLVPIAGAIALAMSITGYNFTDAVTHDRRMGVVAEDVERVMPAATRRIDWDDGHGSRVGVDYGALTGALLPQVTKELVALLVAQEERIAALEARLQAAGL